MDAGRAVRGGVALGATLLVIGCAALIDGEDDVTSIAVDFCKCGEDESLEGAWPGEDCVAHVEGRLAAATDEVRRAWLDAYAKNDCGTCTNPEGRKICKSAAPICAAVGGSCQRTDLCCGVEGQEVYCGDQNVCVADVSGCTPAFAACDPAAPNCCGTAGFKSDCVDDGNGAFHCLESCKQEDASNCVGCCAYYASSGPSGIESDTFCVAPEDCQSVCDPAHGDLCAPPLVCHPVVAHQQGTYYTVDACLETCDPDATDTCSSGTCCVKFHDDVANVDLGRCLAGAVACGQRCDVKTNLGVQKVCILGKTCKPVPLPPSPAGTFSIYTCVSTTQ
jgi:hypothetical protein